MCTCKNQNLQKVKPFKKCAFFSTGEQAQQNADYGNGGMEVSLHVSPLMLKCVFNFHRYGYLESAMALKL